MIKGKGLTLLSTMNPDLLIDLKLQLPTLDRRNYLAIFLVAILPGRDSLLQ